MSRIRALAWLVATAAGTAAGLAFGAGLVGMLK